MTMPLSEDIKSIIKSVTAALSARNRKTVAPLVETVLANVPLEDLQSADASTLADVIEAARKVLASRNTTVVNVEPLGDDRTLTTIAMPNRPFIVDSVLGELRSHNHDIQFVSHPLVERGKKGRTSLVLVIFEKVSAEHRKIIRNNLGEVLDQVRLVTDDWQKMLARIGEAVSFFRTNPPPIPAEDIAEAVQFLDWLRNNNFTLLGLREYNYEGTRADGELKPQKGSALGILRDDSLAVMSRGGKPVLVTPEIRDFLFRPDPLIITKANLKARVHRRTHLDYVGVKRYTRDGKLAGELRIVGLFTSGAYTKSVMTIPVLRHKVNSVLESFQVDPSSHTGKALLNILETWPRDELFQIGRKMLARFADSTVKLEERPRVRALVRADKFDRFVSALIFVPRDRYDSEARRRIGALLEKQFDGYLSAFYPAFLENGLTRVHFIIGRASGKTPKVPQEKLEQAIIDIVETWTDRLHRASGGRAPDHAFPIGYQESYTPKTAIEDTNLFALLIDDGIAVRFDLEDSHSESNGNEEDPQPFVSLKLFHLHEPVPLSQRVPLLENLGFHVIEESTHEIRRADGEDVFLHDMLLKTPLREPLTESDAADRLEPALQAIWSGQADDDNFNALVTVAGLDWQQVSVFRALARYLRQVQSGFTVYSMATTLAAYPKVTRKLAALFDTRFRPGVKKRGEQENALRRDIGALIEKISSSDDDRIMRNFVDLIGATLRTNFYAPTPDVIGEDTPAPVLALKIDSKAVGIVPQPVPYREIFVSSPRVEGLHLRFGPVARGGLRWSDRAQDYRTEVLGLVKAQQVKNAVIVPVGSKGGFVPKDLPPRSDRDAWFEAGRQCYRVYISSLLSLTDNLVDGKVVPPADIVRHDDDDPYFVVAADKGTSTFSDTANAVSQDYDFWLDDAFASGGSAGYDHKAMGITARGGWEAVKRHFREMNRDIQKEPFTAIGVGDMSGDVFGNGMLLSKQTRLIAAFDHRHIFIDPDPDTAKSYTERKRLFNLASSSWEDYKSDLISKGGGVWARSEKQIKLSKQAAEAIGFEAGTYTPQEVMHRILRAPADLMWFGGIGTYIRASHESDSDAGDRSNDAIRVTAKQLRCKVIGEGANLGITQPARIEFARLGGKCNSDAIDNSAGVNSSDVEVNIKIALAAAMKSGRLTRTKRDKLLVSMTDNVADLVLRNNYLQTLSISLTSNRGMEDFPHQQRLMRHLEDRGRLDRAVEDLPDEAQLTEMQAAGQTLTRPEIGVLLAYAKIVALDDLVDSKLPDDPYLETMLRDYFPEGMQKTYESEIKGHRLRREIIATVLANSMINRGGATLINRVRERTGATADQIARAYIAVRDAFGLPRINNAIDALDTKIDGDLQLELYGVVQDRVLSQTVWFSRYGDFSKGLKPEIEDYRNAVDQLAPRLEKIVPEFLVERIDDEASRFASAGVPKDLARTLARLPIAGLVPDILLAAKTAGKPLADAAKTFFALTETFRIGRIVQAAATLEATDYYDALALDRALQSLHQARRDITIDALKSKGGLDNWMESNEQPVQRTLDQMSGIIDADHISVSRLTVAANILADLARG